MNINEAYPSNYLKAHDLQGRNVTVKMDHAVYEEIGKERKLILYFQGKEKGLVLNKTNANNIASIYGDETDDWRGQDITLFEAMVDFQGKTVPAIRVRAPQRQQAKHQAPTTAPKRQVGGMSDAAMENADMGDEIPF